LANEDYALTRLHIYLSLFHCKGRGNTPKPRRPKNSLSFYSTDYKLN